jgi:hypothetical protein
MSATFIPGNISHFSFSISQFAMKEDRSQESGVPPEADQVSAVGGKSLSSIEYPVSSIELLNPKFAIVLRTPTL